MLLSERLRHGARQTAKLIVPSIVVGWGSIGILGAAAVCGLFWLVDFSQVPRDWFALSLTANLVFGFGGALVGIALAALRGLWSAVSGTAVYERKFVRGLVIPLGGGVALTISMALWSISRMPMSPSDPEIWLPFVIGLAAVFFTTYRSVSRTSTVIDQRRVWKGWPVRWLEVTLVALLGPPIFGLILAVGRDAPATEPVVVEQDSSAAGKRLLVIGWDGATWAVLDRLLADGEMKNLSALLETGSRGVLWAAPQEIQPFRNSASGGARSPALWETLATGKMPRQHGVWDFQCTVLPGVEQVIPFRIPAIPFGQQVGTTSQTTRSTRVWEILEGAGVRTAVIGWYSTWPLPETEAGILIADTAVYGQVDSVSPKGVIDFQGILERAFSETQRRLGVESEITGISAGDWLENESLTVYREEFARDLAKAKATEDILRQFSPNFTAVYLRLTDIAHHKFWHHYEPEAFGLDGASVPDGFGELIPASYELMDELLGGLVAAAGPDTTIVILSDHGGGPWVVGGLTGVVGSAIRSAYHPDYSGNHRLNGILVLGGPEGQRVEELGDCRQIDFIPTILDFFGLPLAKDMPGRVIWTQSAEPAGELDRRVRTYDIYRPHDRAHLQESGVDEEIQRQLKSLGYVQ